jgi:hypothetical protein
MRPAIQAAFRLSRPALVEAVADADEKPANPDEFGIKTVTATREFV